MGFGKNHTGVIIREDGAGSDLGALAADDMGAGPAGPAITEDFRMLKWRGTATMRNLTAGEGAGLKLYLVNGELTVAETEECVEANGPLDRNDRVPQERAERFVRLVGVTASPAPTVTTVQFVNEFGSPILEAKPRWTFSNPEGWDWVVYNQGVVLTTGANVDVHGDVFGVWVI